jgi:hypothetical protein
MHKQASKARQHAPSRLKELLCQTLRVPTATVSRKAPEAIFTSFQKARACGEPKLEADFRARTAYVMR